MLLKDWRKKVRYADEYEIQVKFMLVSDGDKNVLEAFADLYIDGKCAETEIIDKIETDDIVEKIPASMKRKAKAFYEYFKAHGVFTDEIDEISYNDNIIIV